MPATLRKDVRPSDPFIIFSVAAAAAAAGPRKQDLSDSQKFSQLVAKIVGIHSSEYFFFFHSV